MRPTETIVALATVLVVGSLELFNRQDDLRSDAERNMNDNRTAATVNRTGSCDHQRRWATSTQYHDARRSFVKLSTLDPSYETTALALTPPRKHEPWYGAWIFRTTVKLFWRLTMLMAIRRFVARGAAALLFAARTLRRLTMLGIVALVIWTVVSGMRANDGDGNAVSGSWWRPQTGFVGRLVARVLVSRSILRLAGLSDDGENRGLLSGLFHSRRVYDVGVLLVCRYLFSWRDLPNAFSRIVDAVVFSVVTLIDVALLVTIGRRWRPQLLALQHHRD